MVDERLHHVGPDLNRHNSSVSKPTDSFDHGFAPTPPMQLTRKPDIGAPPRFSGSTPKLSKGSRSGGLPSVHQGDDGRTYTTGGGRQTTDGRTQT